MEKSFKLMTYAKPFEPSVLAGLFSTTIYNAENMYRVLKNESNEIVIEKKTIKIINKSWAQKKKE